jgi:predicted nucleotidyltransferase component of viral defense system
VIPKTAIEERVREWGLREDIIEKDYVLGWVLWGIGSEPTLSERWAFKGGTCLKKCYIETWRFSEDLDFTVLPGGPITREAVLPILKGVLERIQEASGVDFSRREPLVKSVRPNYSECRVYYTGPRGAREVASVKCDLSGSEVVATPTVLREISHAFLEDLPDPGTVRCYSFEEIFAEKIRAMGERGRPRDLYDIVNLFRREDLKHEPVAIRELLREKCSTKGVPVPTFEAIRASPNWLELESEWENMLGHQLPALPPFADFWMELGALFAWLEGGAVEAELLPLRPPVPAGDELDATWSPPPTVSTWGIGIPLETVRFAAVNHLQVELGYRGSLRVIEPYSLRRTRGGNLIVLAVRSDNREPRAYRVDRIQSVRVLDRTFTPTFRIEFSATGPLSPPPVSSA